MHSILYRPPVDWTDGLDPTQKAEFALIKIKNTYSENAVKRRYVYTHLKELPYFVKISIVCQKVL